MRSSLCTFKIKKTLSHIVYSVQYVLQKNFGLENILTAEFPGLSLILVL